MKFPVDAQLSPALASRLPYQGHAALRIIDIRLLDVADRTIADHARSNGSILISKNADFVILRLPDSSR